MNRSVRMCYCFIALMCIGFCLLPAVATATKAATGSRTATVTGFLQDTANQGDVRQHNTKAAQMSMKTISISGRVSNDGKTFVSDKGNKTWTVSNPDALKGHEGNQVRVKGRVDAEKNAILVISVKVRPTYNPVPEPP